MSSPSADHVRQFLDPADPGSADAARYPDDVRAAVARIAEYPDAAADGDAGRIRRRDPQCRRCRAG